MANIRLLSKELQQIAIDELNEDVSRIPDDIQAIREWLQQKNYITARTDDQLILTFLRGCKFSLERTKEKIESYYTMRTLLPEFFKNRDPFLPEVQEILKTGIFLPILNTRNPLAPRVCFIQCATYDPAKIYKDDLLKVDFMIWDILQKEDDQMNICGMQIVAEYDGVKMAQLFSPTLLLKCLKFIQDCLPCRIKGLHMLNMPSIMDSLFKWMKKILNEKLNSRLLAHNKTMNIFTKLFQKKIYQRSMVGMVLVYKNLQISGKRKLKAMRNGSKKMKNIALMRNYVLVNQKPLRKCLELRVLMDHSGN